MSFFLKSPPQEDSLYRTSTADFTKRAITPVMASLAELLRNTPGYEVIRIRKYEGRCKQSNIGRARRVKESLIYMEGKTITPYRETLFSFVPPTNSLISISDP